MRRIYALDMMRGYALVCIMLNHMPIGVLRSAAISNYAVFDAAELFVLLSGFLVGLVWRKFEADAGMAAAQRRFARRAFEVWRALLIGAVVMALLSWGLLELGLKHTAIWTDYARQITTDPLDYLWRVAILWTQPNLIDVLGLYVVLIASAPVLMPALTRQPAAFAIISVGMWLFAVQLNALLPTERANGGLLFNPFGWQMLFYSGAAMGYFRAPLMAVLRPWTGVLNLLAAFVLTAGVLFAMIGWLGPAGKPLMSAVLAVTGPIDKWSMDGLRFASVMAATWAVAVPMAQPLERLAATRGGRALALIGRGGLMTFVSCVLLSILGDAAQMQWRKDQPVKLAVDLGVVLTLWLVALAWDRWQAHRRHQSQPTAA
ncbi:OpgC domain-containing protein [Paracoccus jiaweipingae]|uniref:OpgC domain-containing protein n=1 Tax=unclassified Paracoccus (in: a-proteobacteria) TaxID=2688777 RepID=UPI0037BD1F89